MKQLAAGTIKILISVTSFFHLSCSDNKAKTIKIARVDTAIAISDTFRIDCELPTIDNFIVRNDTTFDHNNYKGHTIKSFDKKGRLIKTMVSNLFENNSKNIYSLISVYDTAGHMIYENQTKGFIQWHCYRYKYDANGHLISKEGYSSGEMGIKVAYIYEGNKLIKEITNRAGQQTEKLY